MTLLYCISYLLQVYIYIYNIYIIYNIYYLYLYILYVSDEEIKEYSEILGNKYNRYTSIYIYI